MPADLPLNPLPAETSDRLPHRPTKAPSATLLDSVAGLSDTNLMNQLQQSAGTNNRALDELQSRHMEFVRQVVRRANVRADLIEDVAVDVWNRVWRNSTRPAGTQGAWNPKNLRGREGFRCWLKRIAENLSCDTHRKLSRERRQRERLREFVAGYGDGWQEARPEREDACRDESRSRPSATEPRAIRDLRIDRRTAAACRGQVPAAANVLSERQRTALQMRAEGDSNGNIAVALGCGKAQACKIIIKARLTIIERLMNIANRADVDR